MHPTLCSFLVCSPTRTSGLSLLHRCHSTAPSWSKTRSALEAKWRQVWAAAQRQQSYRQPLQQQLLQGKPPAYVLSMFPYPSGMLHMGHVRVYTISDTLARLHRMQGFDVIHPMGWDAFGLPAENAAIERGIQPADWTRQNIAQMKEQLVQMGALFDWDRELATCDAEYYRWTQWIFLQLHKAGIAYRKHSTVNWDPMDQTVLANEQVDAEGRSWRSGAVVEKRLLNQWFFKITDYAGELLDDLKKLDKWPESVRLMQENWIGKSLGSAVAFAIDCSANEMLKDAQDRTIRAFTTRLDTVFGVTFVAVAPNGRLVRKWEDAGLIRDDVRAQLDVLREAMAIEQSNGDGDSGGGEGDGMKTLRGVHLGVHAVHPITQTRVPVFAANYVVEEYATGAVMGVPAHDHRDWSFAQKFGLPVLQVVAPVVDSDSSSATTSTTTGKSQRRRRQPTLPFVDDGKLINSVEYTGTTSEAARRHIMSFLEEEGKGEQVAQYRLRDWLVSRQRYWGAPIPIIHCRGSCGAVPVPEDELPVELPANIKLTGKGGSPLLSESAEAWRHVPCPQCGGDAERETDTLDTFVDSSWYFLRFLDAKNNEVLCDPGLANKHMPVACYVGGIEHAILHLLYSRFIARFLHKQKLLASPEPFDELITQGMVHGETFKEISSGRYVPALQVEWVPAGTSESGAAPLRGSKVPVHAETRAPLDVVWEKMSKSKYNGVDPGTILEQFGADTTRLFMLFKAPVENVLDWDARAIKGMARWLGRVWDLVHLHMEKRRRMAEQQRQQQQQHQDAVVNVSAVTHTTIENVTMCMEQRSLNVAVSHLMQLSNALGDAADASAGTDEFDDSLRVLVKLLAPMAPHATAELWTHLQGVEIDTNATHISEELDVHAQEWPVVDESVAIARTIPLVVQVRGKTQSVEDIPLELIEDKDRSALQTEVVKFLREGAVLEQHIPESATIRRVIVVPPNTRLPKNKQTILVNFVV